ncbi:MAG TPA: saccharopine dehydrogenase NADP-binding domain-containing protein [Nocardioidaceae bacterium]|nr:saccharopine dehydrogenase NADP-binding domain-containing protein [Nocardioidaceae bacterium]
MRILLLGAEGAGAAFCAIAHRRGFFDALVVADPEVCAAEEAVKDTDDRFRVVEFAPSTADDVAALVRDEQITHVVNLADPGLVMPVFEGAFAGGADYLDVAMSPSQPHPTAPYEKCGIKLGDDQFAHDGAWIDAGRLAVVGVGSAPGLTDVLARYAADHLFTGIEELSTRCVAGATRPRQVAGWLEPPVVWELERGWQTTAPLSDIEPFEFPDGLGTVDCVGVEHDEVLLMPRWVDAGRVTYKQGVGRGQVAELRRAATDGAVAEAAGPGPVSASSCVGVLVTGLGRDRRPRSTYLYHAVDDGWTLREYGCRSAGWHPAVGVVIALELIAGQVWVGDGVLGAEAFDPVPFLDLLSELAPPWRLREQ